MGLMADLDINTEHLRWMGDTRFIYGFLRGGGFTHRVCTVGPHLILFLSRSSLAATLSDKDITQGLGAGQAQDERDLPIRLG
jgi:hypothetical protein